jgi:hypothetical protein
MKHFRRKESNMKKFAVLVPLLLVGIMILSMFMAGSGGEGATTTKYNGFKVKEYENGYYVNIEDKNALFQYAPQLLEDINITGYMGIFDTAPMIYVTYDPDSDFVEEFALSQYRLEGDLYNVKGTYVIKGLTKEQEGTKLLPITCMNATQHVPVIEFAEGNETIINILGGNCMRAITRNKNDVTRVEDRIKYYLYGVMD